MVDMPPKHNSEEIDTKYIPAVSWDMLNITNYHFYPTPLLGQDMAHGQFLSVV